MDQRKSLIYNKYKILCIVCNLLLYPRFSKSVLLQQWYKKNKDGSKSG